MFNPKNSFLPFMLGLLFRINNASMIGRIMGWLHKYKILVYFSKVLRSGFFLWTSNFKLIDTGVPQGSVLGPILYLIHVNELPHISDLFSTCLFADDTTLIFENNNKNDLITSCNTGINIFFMWCCANRLSVNSSKT